jgi:hypothetical protein
MVRGEETDNFDWNPVGKSTYIYSRNIPKITDHNLEI